MPIAGIESIVGPSLPGSATWAEVIYVKSVSLELAQDISAHYTSQSLELDENLGDPYPAPNYATTRAAPITKSISPVVLAGQISEPVPLPPLGWPILLNPASAQIDPAVIIHRELFRPFDGFTVGLAGYRFKNRLDTMIPFARDWSTGFMQQMLWTDQLISNLTVVLVDGYIAGGIQRLIRVLNSSPPILPMRTVWSVWPSNHPRPLPLPVFNPLPSLHPSPDSYPRF